VGTAVAGHSNTVIAAITGKTIRRFAATQLFDSLIK
jgi:hypothetical protein